VGCTVRLLGEFHCGMRGHGESDPLLDSVDALRRFDPDGVPESAASQEIFERVRDVLVTIAAIGELHQRDEDATPPAVRAEIDAISTHDDVAGGGFGVKRLDVQDVAQGFREGGDNARAEVVERAWAWMVLMVMIVNALA
jgi:hypothetical protein